MASIKSRVVTLEQASKAAARRPLTDAELAVRLVHILNNPAYALLQGPIRKVLERSARSDVLL